MTEFHVSPDGEFHVSPDGRAYVEEKEGLRLHAYQSNIRGHLDVPTIGFGHTGPDVYMGLVWTKEQADEALTERLATEFEPAVNRVCRDVPTTQGQFDAMVSLAYNIGVGAFAQSSVARFHRAHEYDKAADAFELFDHYHGEVNEALHERRVEEGQRYMDASPARPPAEDDEPVLSDDAAPVQYGHQKAVVATAAGPAVGLLSWYANDRHKLGIPEHVVADVVGLLSGLLVWIVPGGKR